MDEGCAENFTFYWRVWVTWTSNVSHWNLRTYQFRLFYSHICDVRSSCPPEISSVVKKAFGNICFPLCCAVVFLLYKNDVSFFISWWVWCVSVRDATSIQSWLLYGVYEADNYLKSEETDSVLCVYISGKYLSGFLLLHVKWSDSYYTWNTVKQYKELKG